MTQVKPEVTQGCIQLEEVKVLFDASAWAVSVSEEIHVNHLQEEEKVYLIDFSSKQIENEFEAQFIIG